MPETTEVEISDLVQEYLEPISADSPAGVDSANDEEYFKLNMEIQKTTPDYKKCIELSEIILKEKSKDIKVAIWLCFALFRTEKIKGLNEGLSIIYYLLSKYGNNLFPQNESHRSKAIQFLNTTRFFKLVEKEPINKSNAEDIIEADKIVSQIVGENEKLFPGNIPVLKSFIEVIKNHVEAAASIIGPGKKEEQKEITQKIDNNHASVIKEDKFITKPLESAAEPVKIGSEKDAIIQLRKILLCFFETDSDGTKKEIIPESSFVFALSRQLQWSRIFRPLETDKVTQIEPPNQVIQAKIKEYFSGNNWDVLIPRIEINFLKSEGEFRYWLDVQRYVTKALEQKGGNYIQASQEIKIQLAALLKRIPDFHLLKFRDKQTSFADSETVKWLDSDVKSILGSGEAGESFILPPILDEEYDSIKVEYERACSELPKKFEENFALMQNGILNDQRRKGKFLRRLNLANYCFQAKQSNVARINLMELKKLIDQYNLSEWEPALCAAVWQSLYILNSDLISGFKKGDSSVELGNEQKELFHKIANYDGLLAIKLTNKYK